MKRDPGGFVETPRGLRYGETSTPSSNRFSRVRLRTAKRFRHLLWKPRNLGVRIVNRVWPPSNVFGRFTEVRAPWPFWPRVDVLPWPEPGPRPTRLREWCEPGAGWIS